MRWNPGSHLGFQMMAVLATGLLLIALALTNAGFFFDHPKARGLVVGFGRDGARVICGLFGVFLVGLAYWLKLAFR